ncbi:hypothetical protein K466DRAFT_570941, partial [Polyporus arcularius HHB13444]
VQVKIVTPDGVYRTANECQSTDLFFALRGGGGSAFGVVIESTHRVEPLFPIQAAVLKFTPSASTDLAAWYSLMVDNSYKWANEGWGGHIVGPTLIHVTPLLSTEEARASMQPAVDFVTAHNGTVTIEELPSYLAFFTKYVTSAQAAVGPEIELGTRLIPSKFFSTAEGRSQFSALINDTLSFASPYIVAGTPWLYNATAGATAVTPAWRDAIWHLSVRAELFQYNDTLEERVEKYQGLSEHIQKFRDLTPGSGAYFNEGDVYEPDHETAYWGDNYAKLLAVKQKYDPHGLLDCWQCAGWSALFRRSLHSDDDSLLLDDVGFEGARRTHSQRTACLFTAISTQGTSLSQDDLLPVSSALSSPTLTPRRTFTSSSLPPTKTTPAGGTGVWPG